MQSTKKIKLHTHLGYVGKHNKRGHIFTGYGGNDVPESLLQELISDAIKGHKILVHAINTDRDTFHLTSNLSYI